MTVAESAFVLGQATVINPGESSAKALTDRSKPRNNRAQGLRTDVLKLRRRRW